MSDFTAQYLKFSFCLSDTKQTKAHLPKLDRTLWSISLSLVERTSHRRLRTETPLSLEQSRVMRSLATSYSSRYIEYRTANQQRAPATNGLWQQEAGSTARS
ncbi:hypothetical protein AOLI_G00037660 [Acnodon oligacanthus]